MSPEAILFYAFAALTVLSASIVLVAKNPINSAMGLVATFFFLAGIYVLLLAHTIAVLQILVYAGAIMVLFLFVIMLLNLTESGLSRGAPTVARIGGAVGATGLFGLLAWVIAKLPESKVTLGAEKIHEFGTLAKMGELVYTQWLLPFEALSILLLVAIVGSVVVAKARV